MCEKEQPTYRKLLPTEAVHVGDWVGNPADADSFQLTVNHRVGTEAGGYLVQVYRGDEKKPILFYYEDALDCWIPADNLSAYDHEEVGEFELRFKVVWMNQTEFDALEDV